MDRMTPDTIDFNSLSKKQLVELVIAKYNDCFRLEEENKKLKKECEENDYLVEDNARWMKKCEEKIMEIKKLKEVNNKLGEWVDKLTKDTFGVAEENKKLREELSAYDREYFDEDKKAKYIFMDDDTLQELRYLGVI